MEKRIFVIAGVGAIAAAGIFAYFKVKEKHEENETVEVNPVENVPKVTHIRNEKPSLDEYKNMLKSKGYSVDKNEDSFEKVKIEETDPHICSEEDYVGTYAEFDHFTCSWYPDERRLVNLDDDWSVMLPIRRYIGITGEKVLMAKENWSEDFVMYAVDPSMGRVYEILVNLDSTYVEDMNNHIMVAGGDD